MLFYGSMATALVSAFRAWQTWVPVTGMQYGLFGLLGVGANLLLLCLLKGFQYVDASATCPYRYTEFVLSAIYCAVIECRAGNDEADAEDTKTGEETPAA